MSTASNGLVRDQADRVEEYRLFGTAGQARLDTAAGTLTYIRGSEVEEISPLGDDESYPAAEPVNRLIDCRLGRAEVLAGGELGRRVTTVLEALSDERAGVPDAH